MFYREKVRTNKKEELLDITDVVKNVVKKSGIDCGIVLVYVPHTTCSLTINENADPDVKRDIISALSNIGIESTNFYHIEGNSPAHVKATLIGSNISLFLENKNIILGRWQGIMLCEFDGPREREVWIKVIRESHPST